MLESLTVIHNQGGRAARARPWFAALLLVVSIVLFAHWLTSCTGDARPNPKDTVMNLFAAMRASDSAAVRTLVDLEQAFQSVARELPEPADSALINAPADRLLGELTGSGSLRRRWLEDNQIVIGRTEFAGDTAYVEVSFLDIVTRVQYYNKMQLLFQNGRWTISRFRTM